MANFRLTAIKAAIHLGVFTLVATIAAQHLPERSNTNEQKGCRLIFEAEEFKIKRGKWSIMRYGDNYFCAAFAVTFLSRMACLSAPEQCEPAVAEKIVAIPHPGRFYVWARYEMPFEHNTIFTVEIEQRGKVVFKREYGDRRKPRLWAFRYGIQRMPRFPWGGGDNIVWEGHDAIAHLDAGNAAVRLIAQNQPKPAAERHVDLIAITDDEDGIKRQLERASYLPMDGWLTQAGRIFARLQNLSKQAKVKAESSPCYEHSPYWVHVRDWEGRLTIPPQDGWLSGGQVSDWVDVGRQIDSLNDSTWSVKLVTQDGSECELRLELAVRDERGNLKVLRQFRHRAPCELHIVMPADINPKTKLLTVQEELSELCRMIERFPKFGRLPKRLLIFGVGEFVGRQAGWEGVWELIEKYRALMGANARTGIPKDITPSHGEPERCYMVDCRGIPTEKLGDWFSKLGEASKRIAVISLGDEIHIAPVKPSPELRKHFVEYLQKRGIHDGELTEDRNSPMFYWSQMFTFDEALRYYRERTERLERLFGFGNVFIGANYSPHPYYYPTPRQWIRAFHTRAMTLPWSEDYVWGVPELSVQVVGYLMTALRCAARPHNLPIIFYVMPHEPGNTTRDFRLSWWTALAHGAKMLHLFCATPLSVSYTENYISMREPEMYRAIYDVIRETGIAEDFIVDGEVRCGSIGILASCATEILGDGGNFNLEAKCIYYALRHAQLPVEFVTEEQILEGELKRFRALYVIGSHTLEAVARELQRWVDNGGVLFCSVGGGLQNERNEPNEAMAKLLGIEPTKLDGGLPFVAHIKQDLPWIEPIGTVECDSLGLSFPALIYKRKVKPVSDDVIIIGKFNNGEPAIITRAVGNGKVYFAGTFVGAAYIRSAIPLRPWDRGTKDDSFNHFLPTKFDSKLRALICKPIEDAGIEPFVKCSNELVEATVIDSKHGIAVPLMNFSGKRVGGLEVTVKGVGKVKTVRTLHRSKIPFSVRNDELTVKLDLNVADMLLIEQEPLN
ncbi:MAG: hypothetical protein RMK18_11225 [Armatimonadota bacterium]|nr:hypothetical protein [Armatimonadota bacterium]MCX7778362.1 hypothetical protein [Armatimonadota bacterium]MDW8026419.1 hypothetical protein [Armatimonadota bacterium]